MITISQPRSSPPGAGAPASAATGGGQPNSPTGRKAFVRLASRYRSAASRLTVGVAVLLIAAAALRLSAVEGLVRPIFVSGPSMGPTLWGPHRRAICHSCGAAWRIHQQQPSALPQRIPCWNCGVQLPSNALTPVQLGDTVLVDRGAFWLRPPRRGELVAIGGPDGDLRVKRVVAIAGDRVSLAGASLQVNRRPVADAVAANAVAWLPVHDDAFRGSGPPRWQHDGSRHWATLSRGFRWQPSANDHLDQWLCYHHLAVHDDLRPDRVRDDDPGNAGVTRWMAAVDDLRLSGRIVASGPTTIDVVFWQPDGVHSVSRPLLGGTHLWTVDTLAASADIDGAGSDSDHALPVTPQAPVAVRLRGPAATLDRLRITRPVQWSLGPADGAPWKGTVTVAPDRYFVLGDNQPVSIDSRSEPAGVAADQIIGRVILWTRSTARGPSG